MEKDANNPIDKSSNETSTTNYAVPEPPADLFEFNQSHKEQILAEDNYTYLLDKIDYSNGIKVYVQGCPHAKKGFPTPQVVWGINQCKRVFIESVKLFNKPIFFLSGIYFLLLTNKRKIKYLNDFISSYNRLTFDQIRPYILKTEYQTPLTKELRKFIYNFLTNLKIDLKVADEFSVIISHCFEYYVG